MKNYLPFRALMVVLLGLIGFFWISYEIWGNGGGVVGGPALPGADEIYPPEWPAQVVRPHMD